MAINVGYSLNECLEGSKQERKNPKIMITYCFVFHLSSFSKKECRIPKNDIPQTYIGVIKLNLLFNYLSTNLSFISR